MIGGILVAVGVLALGGACASRLTRATRDRPPAPEPPADSTMIAALTCMARELRSGVTLIAAVLAATSRHPNVLVQHLADGITRGHTVTTAATATAGQCASADDALAIHAIAAAATMGGPQAATIDLAAASLRERAALAAERHAHSAQGRLSARVLTIVPIGFTVWSAATSDGARDVYLHTAAGRVCVGIGIALNGVGWLWMRRIVAAAA